MFQRNSGYGSSKRIHWAVVVGIIGMLSGQDCRAEIRKETLTYKTVGELQIQADVFHHDDVVTRPVVVWLHGGALINGNREGIDNRLKTAMLDSGYIVVSFDYRLAPETQLPEVIADVEDGFRWIHAKGPALFHADSQRIAVAGGSAGGYLTLTSGYRVKPRPQCLVSYWGYGDLVGPWYSEPSLHPAHNRSKVTREEAYKQVSGPPVSGPRASARVTAERFISSVASRACGPKPCRVGIHTPSRKSSFLYGRSRMSRLIVSADVDDSR